MSGGTGKQLDLYLTGLLPGGSEGNEAVLRRMYKDIFNYDATGGSAVDMLSIVPFSDFALKGLPDNLLEIYHTALERISIKKMLPEISRDYLVHGVFCASLIFNPKERTFTDIVPFDPGSLEIEPTPLYSRDPLIKVRPDQYMKNFMSSTEPYLINVRNRLPAKLREAFSSAQFTPDPTVTLYMPRKIFPHDVHGISYFKRLIPVYMLEKSLYRANITEANKRIRAIQHIVAGDDEWVPTPEELSAITQMFQQADLDPIGAIVTTRNSISVSEVQQGGAIWRWDETLSNLTPLKLRALGLSEAHLTADVTYATADSAMTSFIDSARAYREMLTEKLFYQKLFPVLAVANGLFKSNASADARKMFDMGYSTNDNSVLQIPEIHWFKHLTTNDTRDTVEMLNMMTEHGIPIPLRMWAAAGGLSIESLLKDLEADKADREALAQYQDAMDSMGLEGMGGLGNEIQDYADEEQESPPVNAENVTSAFDALHQLKPVPLLARDFGADSEPYRLSKTGKKQHIFTPAAHNKKVNLEIAKSVERLSDAHYFAQVLAKQSAKDKFTAYGGR